MKPKQITADVHGMTTQQAKRHLEQLLRTLPDQVEQITVVHGFHHGDALQQMVRGRRAFLQAHQNRKFYR